MDTLLVSHDWYSIPKQSKYSSICRIGQQSRETLWDYAFGGWFQSPGIRLVEFFPGFQKASCRTRRHEEARASTGITVDAGVIISSRSCLAGSRARAIYFLHGRIVNERVTRHTRSESRPARSKPSRKGALARFSPLNSSIRMVIVNSINDSQIDPIKVYCFNDTCIIYSDT